MATLLWLLSGFAKVASAADDRPEIYVSVGGKSVTVRQGESFWISDLPSAFLGQFRLIMGANGRFIPSQPWIPIQYQAYGSFADGRNQEGESKPFTLAAGSVIDTDKFSWHPHRASGKPPKLLEVLPSALEFGPGQSGTLQLRITEPDGRVRGGSQETDPVIFWSSNPEALTVSPSGSFSVASTLARSSAVYISAAIGGTVGIVHLLASTDDPVILGQHRWKGLYGIDPVLDGSGDPDQDGLSNAQEFALGTNPLLADTDQDGLNDGNDADPLRVERITPTIVFSHPVSGQR